MVHRCAKAHRLPVPQYGWVMKARNNSAVQDSEIGSIAGEAECVLVYDYMRVEVNMLNVSGSVMDTDIILCVCVCVTFELQNCGEWWFVNYLVTDKLETGY
jgi:hypothetical protein